MSCDSRIPSVAINIFTKQNFIQDTLYSTIYNDISFITTQIQQIQFLNCRFYHSYVVPFPWIARNCLCTRRGHRHPANIHVMQPAVVIVWCLYTKFKVWLNNQYLCQSSLWDRLLLREHILYDAILESDCLPLTNIHINIPVVYIICGMSDMLHPFFRGQNRLKYGSLFHKKTPKHDIHS